MSKDSFPSQFVRHLRVAAEAAGIQLDPAQVEIATLYATELLTWNARAGLTTIEDPEQVARRHFIESFLLGRMLPELPLNGLDIGSGGGFPGLALRILRPSAAMTLLEPRQAKAAFLRHLGRMSPILSADVRTTRLEDLPARPEWDFASFRGVRFEAAAMLRVLKPGALILGYSGDAMSALRAQLEASGCARVATGPIPGRDSTIEVWRVG